MGASLKIIELKKMIGGLENPQIPEALVAPQLPGGLYRGTLIELLGSQKTEWLLQFLKLHVDFKIFWAEKTQSLLPTAIQQRGVELSRITFATFDGDFVLPLRKVIQSQLYEVVIAPHEFTEIRVLKAFQLFAEKAHCMVFLITKNKPSGAWPIATSVEVNRGPQPGEFLMTLHKQRHREF